jgi:hypothetical protein
MTTISPLCLAVLCLLIGAATWLWRPSLLAVWIISFMVFPTARMKLGSAPIYLYDLMMVTVLGLFWFQGAFKAWPLRIIRWHGWLMGLAFLLSVLYGAVRYGPAPQILWIWGHTCLSWMGFAVGVVVLSSRAQIHNRIGIQYGFLLSAFALCLIAVIQYVNLPFVESINSFFYGGIGAEESIETYRLGALSNRASGPHFAPTTLAGIVLLAAIVFWLVTEREQIILRLTMVSLSLVTMLCTVSRHGLAAVAVGVMVMIVFSENRIRMNLLIGVMAAVLVLGFAAGGGMLQDSWNARMSRFDDGVMEDDNITARVVDGPQRLVAFLGQHPSMLLTGAGIDPEKLLSRAGINDDFDGGFVSNGFLLALYYLGIGGFVLYGGFWVWAFFVAGTASPTKRGILLGCVTMAAIIVAADNYGIMYKPASTLLFLVVGLVAAHRELPDEETTDTELTELMEGEKSYAT